MTSRAHFLEMIQQNPAEESNYLVWADFEEEYGDARLGQLIRAQSALRTAQTPEEKTEAERAVVRALGENGAVGKEYAKLWQPWMEKKREEVDAALGSMMREGAPSFAVYFNPLIGLPGLAVIAGPANLHVTALSKVWPYEGAMEMEKVGYTESTRAGHAAREKPGALALNITREAHRRGSASDWYAQKEALNNATFHNRMGNLSFLLENNEEGMRSDYGGALHVAARNDRTAMAELLLNYGMNVNAPASDAGDQTALHFAAAQGHREMVELLLERGANVNACNNVNTTPLHIAAWNRRKEVVELLLERGADAEIRTTNNNQTAANLARRQEHHEIAAIIDRHLKEQKQQLG